eukprot:tig00000217_g19158.t1
MNAIEVPVGIPCFEGASVEPIPYDNSVVHLALRRIALMAPGRHLHSLGASEEDIIESGTLSILGKSRKLELLHLQSKIRGEILSVRHPETLYERPSEFDWHSFRRCDAIVEDALSSRAVKETAAQLHETCRGQYAKFVHAIVQHSRKFCDYHHQRRAAFSRDIRLSLNMWLDQRERNRKVREEKLEKERLKALKENDTTRYYELLKETKNERLSMILMQTHKFMLQMGAKLVVMKKKTKKRLKPKQQADVGAGSSQKVPITSNSDAANQTSSSKGEVQAGAQESKVVGATGTAATGDVASSASSLGADKGEDKGPVDDKLAKNATQTAEVSGDANGEGVKEEDEKGEAESDSEQEAAAAERERHKKNAVTVDDGVIETEGPDVEDLDEDVEEESDDASEEERELDDNDVLDLQKSQNIYYRRAHSRDEEIKEQPKSLVGGQLRQYQLQGLQWMVSLYNNGLNGILADEMGLGKTIQVIALISYLTEKKNDRGPYLIVVPLSTFQNWVNELQKWNPALTVVGFRGNKVERERIFKTKISSGRFHVMVTTYEFVTNKYEKHRLQKIRWSYIIIDEGHRLKNKNSVLSAVLCKYSTRHRLLLTGTPLQNNLDEVWNQMNWLLPDVFNSDEGFSKWFNSAFTFDDGVNAVAEEEKILLIRRLHSVLRPFLLRRMKGQVESQLPGKKESLIKVRPSAFQWKMYTNVAESGRVPGKSLQNIIVQLRKICNHPYLVGTKEGPVDDAREYPIDDDLIRSSGKLELLDRVLPKLQRGGHRVLLFCTMTRCLDIIEAYLSWKRYNFLRIDGNTKADDRTLFMQQFNAPNSPYFIFLLSLRAGGLGINLQTADTVIIYDTDWNPQIDLQAQARAHRIGQKSEVLVIRLEVISTVEENVRATADNKLAIAEKGITAGRFDNSKVTEDQRRQFLEEILKETDDLKMQRAAATDVPDDEQTNRLLARSQEEFELFQEMDREREERSSPPPKPRLMEDSETPQWLLEPLPDPDKFALEEYGRGARQREKVDYTIDQMTDAQFLQMAETGETRTRRRGTKDGEEGEGPRGGPAKSRGPVELFSNLNTPDLQEKVRLLYDSLLAATDTTGRKYAEAFRELPSREELPLYYQVIKEPLDLNTVDERIKSGTYQRRQRLERDLNLIWNNAMRFNMEDSDIYHDAKYLKELARKEVVRLFRIPVRGMRTREDDAVDAEEDAETQRMAREAREIEAAHRAREKAEKKKSRSGWARWKEKRDKGKDEGGDDDEESGATPKKKAKSGGENSAQKEGKPKEKKEKGKQSFAEQAKQFGFNNMLAEFSWVGKAESTKKRHFYQAVKRNEEVFRCGDFAAVKFNFGEKSCPVRLVRMFEDVEGNRLLEVHRYYRPREIGIELPEPVKLPGVRFLRKHQVVECTQSQYVPLDRLVRHARVVFPTAENPTETFSGQEVPNDYFQCHFRIDLEGRMVVPLAGSGQGGSLPLPATFKVGSNLPKASEAAAPSAPATVIASGTPATSGAPKIKISIGSGQKRLAEAPEPGTPKKRPRSSGPGDPASSADA